MCLFVYVHVSKACLDVIGQNEGVKCGGATPTLILVNAWTMATFS